MQNSDNRWENVVGGVQRDEHWTVFRLRATTEYGSHAQAVTVATRRLDAAPGLYGIVLGHMIRDISSRVDRP